MYLPFELLELVRHPSGLGLALIVLNVLVVAAMLLALQARKAR